MVLICISLMISDLESFHVGHLNVFFGKISIQVLHHVVIRLFVYLILRCMISLYILDISPLSDNMCYKCLLPSGILPFHFADCPLCCEEAFQVDVIPLVYFNFCYLWFWGEIQKNYYQAPCNLFFLLGV